MLQEGSPQHNDIIEVDKAVGPVESSEDKVHETLECCEGITMPEGHDFELEKALHCTKSSLVTVFLGHFYMPVLSPGY